MTSRNQAFRRRVYILAVLIASLVIPGWTSLSPLARAGGVQSNSSVGYATFLPPVLNGYPLPPPSFGTQVKPWRVNQLVNKLVDSNVYWVRFSGFDWNKIEPARTEPPTYDWSTVKESALEKLSNNGMQAIGVVTFVPPWAQLQPPHACGPIKAEAFDAFAQFLQALVQRYGKAPYNIHYWELGNEPDVDPDLIAPDSPYGCWGDEEDEDYYGGGYYADMLKVAYPAIKAADPTAQVLIGGLLMDCDHTNPPPGKDCLPSKFLEGVLWNDGENNGGDFFDVVSFHGYPNYSGNVGGGLYNDENHAAWGHRGGIVLGKINFLREVMANFGVNKPIMHTEGSLICIGCSQATPEFLEAQADYVVWLYVRNLAQGIKATIWYQFDGPGWHLSGLLDENQEPKPAYHALSFLTEELKDAVFKRSIADYPGLKAFEFRSPEKKIWVLWSPDGAEYPLTLPADVQKVFDKYGADITPAGDQITVKSPIYVEFTS